MWNWRKGTSSPTPEHATKLRALPAKSKRGQVRDITEEEAEPLCKLLEDQGHNGSSDGPRRWPPTRCCLADCLNLRATPEELAKIAAAEKRA